MKNYVKAIFIHFFASSINVYCQSSSTTLISKDLNTPRGSGDLTSGISSNNGGLTVDHYTGRLNCSIPLGDAGDVYTSVGLSYNTGGFKQTTPSGPLGLGWNLQVGGAVSRELKGIADEVSKTYKNELKNGFFYAVRPFENQNRIEDFDPMHPHQKLSTGEHWEPKEDRFLEKLSTNEYDTERDIFTISAPGISGSFFLTSEYSFDDIKAKIIPPSNFTVTVVPIMGYPAYNSFYSIIGIEKFIITSSNGTRYYFTKSQTISSRVVVKRQILYVYNPQTITDLTTEENDPYVSSWLLEKIILPNNDLVKYEYLASKTLVRSYSSCLMKFNDVAIGTTAQNLSVFPGRIQTGYTSIQEYISWLPLKIETESCKVEFDYASCSKNHQGTEHILEAVRFYSFGRFKGKTNFTFGFIQDLGGTSAQPDDHTTRVVLTGIENFDRFGNSPGETKLRYFDGADVGKGFPFYDNLKIDHWGYFNGSAEDAVAGVEPGNTDNYIGNEYREKYYREAARRQRGQPNILFGRIGSLQSIESPNRIKTSITYGSNRGLETNRAFYAGGIRVDQLITEMNINGVLNSKTTGFLYGKNNSQGGVNNNPSSNCWLGGFMFYNSSGLEPVGYASDYYYEFYSRKQQLGIVVNQLERPAENYNGSNNRFTWKPFLVNYDFIQSTPCFTMEDELGRSVVYTLVKEIQSDGSFRVLEFSEPEVENFDGLTLCSGVLPAWQEQDEAYDNTRFAATYQEDIATNPFFGQASTVIKLVNQDGSISMPALNNINNRLPYEVLQFSRLIDRNRIFKIMDMYKSGGQLLKERIYQKDGFKLIKESQFDYKFIVFESIKSLRIQCLNNYSTTIFRENNSQNEQWYKDRISDYYILSDKTYPNLAQTLGARNLYLYNCFQLEVGNYFLESTCIKNYNPKSMGNPELFLEESSVTSFCSDANSLVGKPCSSLYKKKGVNNELIVKMKTEYRYPSDILTQSDIQYLKQSVYNNSVFFNNGNCNRATMALAYLIHNNQSQDPLEILGYESFDDGLTWRLVDVKLNIPYFWGNLINPNIGIKYVYSMNLEQGVSSISSLSWNQQDG